MVLTGAGQVLLVVLAGLAVLAVLGALAAAVRTLARTVEDLRARTREAEAARERAERLVACTAGTVILACDADGVVELANPGAVEAFGHPVADLVGRSVAFVVAPGELAEQAAALGTSPDLRSVLAACARTPGDRREWILRRADGQARVHALGVAPMTDATGAAVGHVLTSEDVTDRIVAQEVLVAAYVAEHDAVRRLHEVDGVKDTLVATVSHELRTPITNILGFTEMLEEGEFGGLSGAQASAVQRVTQNSRRLLSLVDDLLTLSRVRSGLDELVPVRLDLRVVAERAAVAARTALRGKGAPVRLEVGLAPRWVEGDEAELERLVVGLLSNAAKFTPDTGQVVLRLHAGDDDVVLEVADTGLGIPADEVDRVFERFFRARNAWTHQVQGAGLGLAIVAAVAEQHGGRVQVASVEGVGSTFTVTLPRAFDPLDGVDATTPGVAVGRPGGGAPPAPAAYAASDGDFELHRP